MDEGHAAATLEVGFAIDTGGSFAELERLQGIMNSSEAVALKAAGGVERAFNGVNVSGATAQISSFGNAATREMQTAARETARAEKAGEALVRSLDRQASTFGKTASEIRAMKAETAALAAEQSGLIELASRIRAAEQSIYDAEYAAARRATIAADELAEAKALAAQASEREAAAMSAAAAAAERDAREHAALAAMVRASHDAQLADAAAAERMREKTDPLYLAVKRLNAEIAESTRLYHSGATAPAEYARQQEVLTQRLRATTEQHDAMALAGGRNANALKMMAIQVPDIAQGLLTGQKPMTIFIQQGGQLVQIAMMAEGGIKGLVKQLAVLAVMAAPIMAVVGVAAGGAYVAFKRFQDQVKDDGELTRYRDSLGLTRKEMEQLSDGVEKVGGKIKSLGPVTVTFGDEMAGIWKTIKDQADSSGTWDSIKSGAGSAFDWILEAWQKTAAGITAGIYGTANAIKVIWGAIPSLIGQVFVNAANLAIAAMNALVRAGVAQINGFIAGVNTLLPASWKLGAIEAPQIDYVKGLEGAKNLGKAIAKGYTDAYATARKEDDAFWARSKKNAEQITKDRQRAEADAIIANRTPHTGKPKVDHTALNNEAVESQIKNLYKLADAYDISGAAALVAEARVKAESDAIKKRGDIEEYLDRQIRLTLATRVSDAAKATAGVREQANAQEKANEAVAAGLIPAERAADMVKDQIADLPLLAAIQVAQMRGLKDEADRATRALADQRAERERLRKAEEQGRFDASMKGGDNQLAQLQAELSLIGATDNIRTHTLAVLKATQEAEAMFTDPAKRQAYIDKQVEIADTQQNLVDKTREYNDALSWTADRWGLIADNVQKAASGISDAFGASGQAIGNIAAIYTAYRANEERLKKLHADRLKESKTQASVDRENARFQLANATTQIGAYGDMLGAAKGFFNEKSKGYQALQAAEQAFRAVQLAMSIAAMFQDTAETTTHVLNAGARATADGAAGVAAQSKLPFPANIAAMAATAAALVAAGISLLGGHGGGSKAPVTNTGTGTVLGDPTKQSESIKNAIDALQEVDLLTNTYSRQMAASLKSIDHQIGGVASLVTRAGDVNADSTVTTGFKANAIGSVLGAIPLVGGILKSLFGSTTSITGNGLYGGPQSLDSVLNGGFNAQYYSDVQKKSKFLGITTGTKNYTQYTTADAELTNQFTMILRQFDAAILAAAGPLGVATSTIEQRLSGFVVNIGKLDLKGLTGEQIQEKLSAVFGAAADDMARAAFPGIEQFQKVGEGLFETLVRVSSTVEAVGTSLDMLGTSAQQMTVAAKLGLADQFDTIGDLTGAVDAYFQAFYSAEEQSAAKSAQLAKVFGSLNLAMPDTLAGFRALVEAQDLTTAAGQATYATLLQLAPAFADLKSAMEGAKSAADIASERQDLERQLLELRGDTAALRALDLAKVDASNRALQQEIWSVQDAQAAAKAAQDLADSWKSVGDSITDEIKRIRGLNGANAGGSFADLQGQFNAASAAARAGDIDAAKSLPGLSQALLTAAGLVATSRQELDRVQAQTAASLEATQAAITRLSVVVSDGNSPVSTAAIIAAAATQAASMPAPANDDLVAEVRGLRAELAQLREDNNKGHAATAGNTGAIKRKLDDVTPDGDAIATRAA